MLKTVKVDYLVGSFSIHDFVNAIEARIISSSDGIARLQAVEINLGGISSDASYPTTIQQLCLLREIGLEITFLGNGKDIFN